MFYSFVVTLPEPASGKREIYIQQTIKKSDLVTQLQVTEIFLKGLKRIHWQVDSKMRSTAKL